MAERRRRVARYIPLFLALALIVWGGAHIARIYGLERAQLAWQETQPRLTFVCQDSLSEGKIASYWAAVVEGMQAAADRFGVSLNCVSPPDTGGDEGMRLLYRSVASCNVDGIICVGTDQASLSREINQAWAHGIPTVCLDGDVPGSKRIAYFGTDNYAMGAQAGRIILDSIPQKGAVYITLMQAITNQFQQRIDGMAAAVQAVDGMRVVMDPHWESNRNQFQIASEIRNALEAHPDIVAIYSPGSLGIVYAAQEVQKARGSESGIVLVSIDDYSAILETIRKGTVTATIAQMPYAMGYQAIEFFAEYLRTGEGAGSMVFTGTVVIDRAGINDRIG